MGTQELAERFRSPTMRCLQEMSRTECITPSSRGEETASLKAPIFLSLYPIQMPHQEETCEEGEESQPGKEKRRNGEKRRRKASKGIGCESWLCNRSFVRQISFCGVINGLRPD